MNRITRKSAQSGYVYQIYRGAEMTHEISKRRASAICAKLGAHWVTAITDLANKDAVRRFTYVNVPDHN